MAGGGTPYLLFDSINTTGEGGWDFGKADASFYAGHGSFSDPSAHAITKVVFKLSKAGASIAGKTFVVKIWADGAPNLGSLLGTSDTVSGSDSWAKTLVDFPFPAPVPLAATTSYHLTLSPTGPSDGGSFAVAWYTTPTVIPGQLTYFTLAGVNPYATTFGNHDLQFQLWGTTP